jgi:alpha-beta hydrolase superfamily lysophospholipase
LESQRDKQLRSWEPQCDARAVLAVVPDWRGHSGHYERFATVMVAHGIATHVLDSQSLEEISVLTSASRVRHPLLPVFLLAHGTGAVAASRYALPRQHDLAGLICESIALDLPASTTLFGLVRALARIAPGLPIRGTSNERYSRDESFVERLNRDPFSGRQSARSIAALDGARKLLKSSLAELSMSLLVLHGSSDTVTLPSGSEYLYERAGSPDKTLQIFEGYYHDLINDRGHEQVVERILQWIEARLNPEHRGHIGIAYINTDT